MGSSTTDYNVTDLYSFVKKYDKEFTPGRKVHRALLNKDGTPKILYHNTNSDFTEFDTNMSGRNQGKTHGDGIYLSSNPTVLSTDPMLKIQKP
ncbi:MAG: hypothetical protein J5874_06650 [Oscillospiraceae bacterium]|nr:hypothetical protein [Oscillospiraceae bacterium]